MPRTLRSASLALVLAAYQLAALAQLKPSWSAQTGAVQWMRTTAAGALVVSTTDGLKGIDPANGTVLWTVNELANAPEEGYSEPDRSPFITVAPAGKPDALFIVEPFSGAVAFSSDAAGISNVTSKHFLYANDAIVLVGQKADKKAAMACVDMSKGKVRWTKDDSFSRITACASAGPDAILLSTLFFAYKLDANTGDVLWKKSPDPAFEKMAGLTALLDKGGANINMPGVGGVFVTTPYAPDLCIMGMQTEQRKESTDSQGKKTVTTTYKTFVNAFRIDDGAYVWSAPLQFQQKLGTLVPLERGLLIGAGDNRSVDLVDYSNGRGIWGKNGKGINVKGILAGAVVLGDKTLLTSGKDDGVVTLVDAAGEEVWKRPAKLDGVVEQVSILGGDVLVATAEEVDVIDLATGLSRQDKPLKGGAGLVAMGDGAVWIFNTKDGLLYSVPSAGGKAGAVGAAALVFEGKEKPTRLEHTAQGLVVSSDQNLALLKPDGSTAWKRYLPAPRESGLVRALKYASAVRAAYYTAALGYTSAAFGAASQSIQVTDANSALARDITGAVSQVYGEGAKQAAGAAKRFFDEARARFKATLVTSDIQFVMTVAGKGSHELHALSKTDGSTLATIPLGSDKSPKYEVDAFSNAVYLVDGGSVKQFKL